MKKFLSAIMAMAMAFSCITVAFAAEVTVPDGVTAAELSTTEAVEVSVGSAAYSGTKKSAGYNYTGDNRVDVSGSAFSYASYNGSIYVDAPQAGEYKVAFTTIDNFNDSTRNMTVTVNDDADTAVTTIAANGWQTWMATEVILVLDEGVNKVTVSGNGNTKWYKAAFTKAISIACEACGH